jgi:hypothetical protein
MTSQLPHSVTPSDDRAAKEDGIAQVPTAQGEFAFFWERPTRQSLRQRPSVEGIGRWSARHPWRAIGACLVFVVIAVAAAVTGSKDLLGGATGESARADSMIQQHQLQPTAHGSPTCTATRSRSLIPGSVPQATRSTHA